MKKRVALKNLILSILLILLSTVAIGKEYNRIIAGTPAIGEILFELGLKDKLIAIDKNCNVEELKDIPKFSFYNINTESIYSLKGDLLIFSAFNKADREDFTEFMKSKGVDVIYEPEVKKIEDIYKLINEIGEVTKRKKQAEELINRIKSEIEEVEKLTRDIPEKKKGYFELAPYPKIYTFGSGVFMNEILEKAGVENIFKENKGWFIPNVEAIMVKQPDLIFTSTYQLEDPVGEILNRKSLGMVTAVKNREVYYIDPDTVRPSIRVGEVIREIFETAYPERK